MSRTDQRKTRIRWCTAEAPPPMLAYYEAPDVYPGVARRMWCRLYRLMIARGLLADAPAERLARFLVDTDAVNPDGTIPEARQMLELYAARARVSMVTAWADLRRLVDRGLVRQVQAAAPGHRARYRLSAPVAAIREHMPDLPADMARVLYRHLPEPGDTGQDRQDDDPGSSGSCGGLNTTPSMREGSPPPPASQGSRGRNRRSNRPCRGNHDSDDTQAIGLLARCRASWVSQRGASRVPELDELAPIVPLTRRALELTGRPGDVEQLLTERVASADDLVRTLRWRLSREVADARRAEQARLSPEEEAAAEQRAAEHYRAQAAARQAAVEARRRPGYRDRVRSVVEQARRIRDEREAMFAEDRRIAEEIAAREAAENAERRARWLAETAAAEEIGRVVEEVRRLAGGTAEERSRARALAQLTRSRVLRS